MGRRRSSPAREETFVAGVSPGRASAIPRASHDRWVVNKLRALCGYYTKGFEGGPHLRVAVNQAPSVAALRSLIEEFFAA